MLVIFMIYCILASLLFKFLIFLAKNGFKRYQLAHFPQNFTIFPFGEVKFLLGQPPNAWVMHTLKEIADKFEKEKFCVTHLGPFPIVLLFNKDHIKKILSKNDSEYLNKSHLTYGAIEDFAPCNLFTVDGARWKIRRRILSQPFHTSNLGNFVEIANLESKKMVEYLKNNECKDLSFEIKKISMYVYYKLLFEYDIGNDYDNAYELSAGILRCLTQKGFHAIFMTVPFLYRFTKLAKKENILLKKLMKLKKKILAANSNLKDRLEEKLKSKNQEISSKAKNLSVIEILLMNLKDKIDEKSSGWPGFDMREIASNLSLFIVAGIDTQSLGLTNLIYDLAKHPQYQQKIYEEIQLICSDNNIDNGVTLDEIKQMTFLGAFVKESLRFIPVFPLIGRHLTKEIKLNEKYTIPAGTEVGIYLEHVLKDPDYFPDPDVFRPERFLGDQKDDFLIDFAFSAGPRACIAKKLAFQLQCIVAVILLKNFKIEFTPSTPEKITTYFELVNRPKEKIELKFVPRS